MLGPSTGSIVEEAKQRGIPTQRLNDESFIQLGYGAKQRRIQATLTDRTSALGAEIADEKYRTKRLLAENGIPTPAGAIAHTVEDASRVAPPGTPGEGHARAVDRQHRRRSQTARDPDAAAE